MIMTSEIDKILQSMVFRCPFSYCCMLEKKDFLCKLPECKECTEYNEIFKKAKQKHLF